MIGPHRVALVSACLLALAAASCTQTSSPPAPPNAAAIGVTPSSFRLPEGSGCAGEVARFRAVIDNDEQTGNVNEFVYKRIRAETDSASAACAAGRDAEATRMVASTKARFGYR